MTSNPICEAMGWQAPGETEHLIISLKGRDIAQLTGRRGYYMEGLYRLNPAGHQYGPAFSITGLKSRDQIRAALANKLGVKVADLDALTTEIYSAGKLRG
jgi:hypothetical protein